MQVKPGIFGKSLVVLGCLFPCILIFSFACAGIPLAIVQSMGKSNGIYQDVDKKMYEKQLNKFNKTPEKDPKLTPAEATYTGVVILCGLFGVGVGLILLTAGMLLAYKWVFSGNRVRGS